jgi:tRNA-2-methylthio-N6-dimethylallyladenosine synthase
VIAAMAETPAVMPQLHMPLQSGSDRVLRAMRRSYRSEKFLGIIDRVRAALPDAAISTDIIVGFPGETEDDFAETLRVVERSRFASAFTFQYSVRPGTPAGEMADQIPKAVVQERFERLTALQDRISAEENRRQVGRTVDVLVATDEGRKDASTHRLSGRAEDSRLVHFEVPTGRAVPRPGDVVSVRVTDAAPFYLLADAVDGPDAVYEVRRTRAGDAWDAAQAASCGVPSGGDVTRASSARPARVSLGLPTLRVATTPIYSTTDDLR